AQRVLHTIAELGENLVRHVERILRYEIDPDAFRADQTDHLLDLVEQGLRRFVEQQMRFVEEEAKLRLGRIADLGQFLEQLRQQPQQEGGIEPRALHQLVGCQDIDEAAAIPVGTDEVLQRQSGLAEELAPTLVLQDQKLALDGADRRLRHVPVLHGQFGGMVRDEAENSAQILEIEDYQSLLVGDPEADIDHALLD